MNQKELGELRRRMRPDKNNISHIYGCFVGSGKDVIAYLDEPMTALTEEEAEKYTALLRRALSGTLGRNLIDVAFSNEQVMDSEEHRLLSALRDGQLRDTATRELFFQKAIASLDMGDSSYLILLACDTYDVPRRTQNDEVFGDASDEVFRYILCAVCPVRDCKLELGYFPGEKEFRSYVVSQIVSPPELGFLFPAFDDRAANLYNALFYSRSADQLHREFIDGVFHTEPPLSAAEQKEAFQTALAGALADGCSMEVVQAVHEQLRERIEQHKESRDPEPLEITPREVGGMLRECGVPAAQAEAFEEQCAGQLGDSLRPANLIDSRRFEVKANEVTITVDPAHSHLIETRVIDGRKYLLIPADAGVEVGGLAVGLEGE